MYNQPFFIPGYFPYAGGNMLRGASLPNAYINSALKGAGTATRGGLFGKLGSAFGAVKSFNWGGLINNTSKTLGIINQSIPLVKQVGPMVGNVKSMLKVASVFKDETDSVGNGRRYRNGYTVNVNNNKINNSNSFVQNTGKINEVLDNSEVLREIDNNNDSPTFFIN